MQTNVPSSPHVLFFGHLVTSKGLKPDPKKTEAIIQMPVPQNKTQLQSFIGLCNYLTCYIPHLTDVLLPLCAITVKASEFQLEKLHSGAVARAKQVIANLCVLQYFNSEDPIVIQVDASSIGVGAALLQQGRVVSYHSRALTAVQQRYSNIECECYGLVNGIEHFHHYIFGWDFVVQTDHQLLVQLTEKPLCKISPRLQRLLLKVTQYSFNTVYIKHEGVPIADCLSRNIAIDTAKEDKSLNITIATISLFQEGKLLQIKQETAKDILLVKLAHVIQNGWPVQQPDLDQELYVFWIHRLNLSIVDGIIMNRTLLLSQNHCKLST